MTVAFAGLGHIHLYSRVYCIAMNIFKDIGPRMAAKVKSFAGQTSSGRVAPSVHEIQYVAGLVRLYEEVKEVPGHVLEIGTGSGRNALILGELIKFSGQSGFRRYYGFDTFAGYTNDDLASTPHLSRGAHRYSKKETEARISNAGLVGLCRVFRGDIKDILPGWISSPPDGVKFGPSHLRIALLYLDCNSYRAASVALSLLGPFLSPGAIVAVDETIQGGETKALQEWSIEEGWDMHAGRFGSVISSFVKVPFQAGRS